MTSSFSRFRPLFYMKGLWEQIKKVVRSKTLVSLIVGLMILMPLAPTVSHSFAKDDDMSSTATWVSSSYNFGTVYQQYLLGNSDALQKAAKGTKLPLLGNLGSGSISGSFSYDSIVQSSPGDAGSKQTEAAKSFSRMMSTYSFYNYISYRPQGFSSIIPSFVRVLTGVLITIFGIITDFSANLQLIISHLLLKMNIIPLLTDWLVHSTQGEALQKMTGLSGDEVKTFFAIAFTTAIAFITWSILMTFRRGATNVDKSAMSKLKGRILTLLLLPLSLTLASAIFSTVTDSVQDLSKNTNNAYARYLIDDESWARNKNFAPAGKNRQSTGGFSSSSGSYIDTKFEPYSGSAGADRIRDINDSSNLANGNQLFPNTSLALAYMSGDVFNARSWLDYQGSYDSYKNNTYGSYYEYIYGSGSASRKELLDTSNNYDGTFLSGNSHQVNEALKGNFTEATDDYQYATLSKTWQDRFIYGAKDSGDKADKYYESTPTAEQVASSVGSGHDGNSLSDQSMYLALNTQFDANGGHYLLTIPTKGIFSKIPQFDSSRGDYYNISMVGSPIFTVPAMLTTPIISLIMLFTLVIVLLSVGVVEMNVKPVRALVKAFFTVDYNYVFSFLIQVLGIVMTYLMVLVAPGIFMALFNALMEIIGDTFKILVGGANNPTAGLVSAGVAQWFNFLIALLGLFIFFKVPRFSRALIGFFTYPWEWATQRSAMFERQAVGGGMSDRVKEGTRKRLNRFDNNLASGVKKVMKGNALLGNLGEEMTLPEDRENPDMPTPNDPNSRQNERGTTFASLLNRGKKAWDNKSTGEKFATLTPDFLEKTNGALSGNSHSGTSGSGSGVPATSETRAILDKLLNDENIPESLRLRLQDAKDQLEKFEANPTRENAEKLNDMVKKAEDEANQSSHRLNDNETDAFAHFRKELNDYQPASYEMPLTNDGNIDVENDAVKKETKRATELAQRASNLSKEAGTNSGLQRAQETLEKSQARFNKEPSVDNYKKLHSAMDTLDKAMGTQSTAPVDVPKPTTGSIQNVAQRLANAMKSPNLSDDAKLPMKDVQTALNSYQAQANDSTRKMIQTSMERLNGMLESEGMKTIDMSQVSFVRDQTRTNATNLVQSVNNQSFTKAMDKFINSNAKNVEANKEALGRVVQNMSAQSQKSINPKELKNIIDSVNHEVNINVQDGPTTNNQ